MYKSRYRRVFSSDRWVGGRSGRPGVREHGSVCRERRGRRSERGERGPLDQGNLLALALRTAVAEPLIGHARSGRQDDHLLRGDVLVALLLLVGLDRYGAE